MTYRVYVLRNQEGRLYVGQTDDVERRLAQHNAGISNWTAKYRPWVLVWTSALMNLSDARKLENLLKRQKGGQGFYNITGLPPHTNPSAFGS